VIAGITSYLFAPIAVFWVLAAMAVASVVAVLSIPPNTIDHEMARGLTAEQEKRHEQPSGFRVLLECRPLLIFAACVTVFHFANAAMLPLIGQKLALADRNLGTSLMSVCIVAAQIVMVPMAMLVGAKADIWGRKPLFLSGLAVLAIRGVLYTLSNNPYWLVAVQLLDGVGARIFGALFPLVVADLTRGTGRFNVSQGAIATAQGIGASLSNAVAGFIVVWAGYSTAFLFLGGIAASGFLLYWLAMPETMAFGSEGRQGDQTPEGVAVAARGPCL
jgi:MFS family permease